MKNAKTRLEYDRVEWTQFQDRRIRLPGGRTYKKIDMVISAEVAKEDQPLAAANRLKYAFENSTMKFAESKFTIPRSRTLRKYATAKTGQIPMASYHAGEERVYCSIPIYLQPDPLRHWDSPEYGLPVSPEEEFYLRLNWSQTMHDLEDGDLDPEVSILTYEAIDPGSRSEFSVFSHFETVESNDTDLKKHNLPTIEEHFSGLWLEPKFPGGGTLIPDNGGEPLFENGGGFDIGDLLPLICDPYLQAKWGWDGMEHLLHEINHGYMASQYATEQGVGPMAMLLELLDPSPLIPEQCGYVPIFFAQDPAFCPKHHRADNHGWELQRNSKYPVLVCSERVFQKEVF